MNSSWNLRKIGAAALWSGVSLLAAAVQASPVKVYVNEGAIVNAGTSYLGLHLLQPDGSQSTQQVWNVYVGSFDIGVAKTPGGPRTTELAFCVDPWNWSASGSLGYWQDSLATMSTPSGATYDIRALTKPEHVTEIEALYSNYYQGTLGNTAKSAAFQLALWELVSDNHVDRVAGTNSTIWTDGQAILTALSASGYRMGSRRYDISAYYVDRGADGRQTVGQNYLVASAVPEPGSLSLLALGLAGLGLRRRNNRVAV